MILFAVLLTSSFAQTSFASGDYDLLYKWGKYGPTETSHFVFPQYIAVGEDGSIYVSDFGNKRIQKFSSTGEYVSHWGNSGKQLGDFYNPTGIAVSDDSVFVVDRDLNRIQKFSLDGEFITTWGKKGTAEGQFFFPNGITLSNGLLYVVDTGNQRIQVFSTDGEFVSSFGSSGLGPGQLLNVSGIDADEHGNIFVTDKGNRKIEKFSADGELLQSFQFYFPNYVFSPEAIAIDPNGDMLVVNSYNDKILHLSQNSELRLSLSDQNGPYLVSFKEITAMVIGINGELLVVDSPTHSIQSFETTFFESTAESYFVVPAEVRPPSRDQIKPVIIVPDSIVVEAEDMLTDVFVGNANATDASGIKIIINNAPDAFKPGITNLIWIAFDNAGHSSTDTQRITVNACGHNYSDYNLIEGTSGDDVISGTDGDDLIFGLAGNDLISGGLGNDCIFGGLGDDIISGDEGNDTIKGNSGNDILKGQSGSDLIYANSGSDVIVGDYPVLYNHVDKNVKIQNVAGAALMELVDIDVDLISDGEVIRGFNYVNCRAIDYTVETDAHSEESYVKNKFALENIFDFECQGYHPNNLTYDAMFVVEKANTLSSKDLRNTQDWRSEFIAK